MPTYREDDGVGRKTCAKPTGGVDLGRGEGQGEIGMEVVEGKSGRGALSRCRPCRDYSFSGGDRPEFMKGSSPPTVFGIGACKTTSVARDPEEGGRVKTTGRGRVVERDKKDRRHCFSKRDTIGLSGSQFVEPLAPERVVVESNSDEGQNGPVERFVLGSEGEGGSGEGGDPMRCRKRNYIPSSFDETSISREVESRWKQTVSVLLAEAAVASLRVAVERISPGGAQAAEKIKLERIKRAKDAVIRMIYCVEGGSELPATKNDKGDMIRLFQDDLINGLDFMYWVSSNYMVVWAGINGKQRRWVLTYYSTTENI